MSFAPLALTFVFFLYLPFLLMLIFHLVKILMFIKRNAMNAMQQQCHVTAMHLHSIS